MNKENYRLLQVDENASDEEIKACYERLKEIYNEEKWKDGEEGNNAARMLEKLDIAYQEIMEERREKASNTSGASSFEEVATASAAAILPVRSSFSMILTSAMPNGTTCSPSYSIRRTGCRRAKNSSRSPFRWTGQRQVPRGVRQAQNACGLSSADGRRTQYKSRSHAKRGRTDGRQLVFAVRFFLLYLPLRELPV